MKDSSLQKRASIILITGVIFMVSIGVLYAWSVISRVIIEEWSWTSLQAGVPFSLALVFFATGNLIGGRLQVKISARIVGTIGGAMVGGGFLLCGLFGNNPIAVAICFGVITGLGVGFGYSSFLPTLLKWYHPGRKGFVSGWIIGGFGLTSLYLAPLSSYLLYNFDIKLTFIILGIKTLVISLPLAQFIKSPPDGYTPPIPSNMKQKSIATLPVDKTWKEMMATNEFYLLFFMFLCSVSIGQMVIGNITGIAELQAGINNASLLAGLVAFMA
ncbi:MAG: MFS transporter, partial [Oscillospiraceae bacterium]|nr:MFS transporter [Oscillospiraceae bacterium]